MVVKFYDFTFQIYPTISNKNSGRWKGLGSLTNNFCPANFENISLQRASKCFNDYKYNLFTVNKWIFKTPKCILYQKTT